MILYDLTSGFSHIELHPAVRRFVGFHWQGKYYVCNVLPFGLRSSPYAFTKTVSILVARRRQAGIKVLPYLDDFLFSRYMEADIFRLDSMLEGDLRRACVFGNLEKGTTVQHILHVKSDTWVSCSIP
jgi:hypothetical protein